MATLGLVCLAALVPAVARAGSQTGPPAGQQRVEQDAAAVTYSGGSWYPNQSGSDSGGSAVLSMDAGARASFSFTGSAVAWVGYSDAWSGIADIYIDGIYQTSVDTYTPDSTPQALLYSIGGLSPAGHTLSIVVTGAANPAAAGSWIWVDAFDFDPYFEQDASAVSLAGDTWYFPTGDAFSAGEAAMAYQAGTTANFSFSGTGVSWIGYSNPDTGIADVQIDGTTVTEVDSYAPTDTPQVELYSVDGLAPGPHTLSIAVTGRQGPAADEAWIVVDAFRVHGFVPRPDTQPPTLSLRMPADGWSVSGNIALEAESSDDTGVAGVQFLLDGAPFGPELIHPPYRLSWDTGSATPGDHSLAVQARDVAGNEAAAPAVTLHVQSGAQPMEERAVPIAYTGTWYEVSDPGLRGGSMMESNETDATATLSFTGTGASWISYLCSCNAGITEIYVDGGYQGDVDTYSFTPTPQAAVYTIANLPEGQHTLMLKVTGRYHRDGGESAYVAVDGFDVIP